jgi:hypothetical protein
MPNGGFFREGVVEVGKDEATAARQAEKEEIAEPGGEDAQKRFGRMRKEPTEKF